VGDLPDIDRDIEAQREQVRAEAERQRQQVEAQAREAEENLRQQKSDIEREAEAAIGQARKAEALEQRKRDLPYTRPRELGTKQRIAEVEQRRTAAFGEAEKGKEAISKAKAEALAGIASGEALSLTQIEKAGQDAKAAIKAATELEAFESQNVKLDFVDPTTNKSQYIAKSEWDTLTTQAQNYVKRNGVDAYNTWSLTHYWECTTQTPQQAFTQAQKENKIPEVATLKSWKDDGTLVWDMPPVTITTEGIVYSVSPENGATKPTLMTELTPQSSESVWDKIGSYLKKQFVTGWDVPDQETLKAKYEKESAQPLWSRMLFGPTVVYDKENDKYYPLVLNIADIPITGIGGGTGVATRVGELPITRAAWEAILKSMDSAEAAQAAKINWSAVTQAIKAGEIRDIEEAARWAAAQARWFKPITAPVLTEEQQAIQAARTAQGMADAAEAAARVRAAGVAVSLATTGTTFMPVDMTKLTLDSVTKTIKEWESMTPKKVVTEITASGLMTIAIATDPVTVSRIITNMTPSQRANVLTTVAPAIAQAIDTKALTKAQIVAIEQIQIQAQLQTLTQQAVKLANQLQTQGKTQVEIQTALQNLVQPQVQQMVKTQTMTKTQAQIATQTLTKTALQVATQTQTKLQTRTETTTKTREATKPREPLTPRVPKLKFKSAKGEELTSEELKRRGAVGWKQGWCYHYWYRPFGKNDIIHSQEPIPGIPIVKGAKSAYKSVVKLGGEVPPVLTRAMGIQRVTVTTPREGKPRLAFVPIPRQRKYIARARRSKGARRRPHAASGTVVGLSQGRI
jgi:hypothetical protein